VLLLEGAIGSASSRTITLAPGYVWVDPNALTVKMDPRLVRYADGSVVPAPGYVWLFKEALTVSLAPGLMRNGEGPFFPAFGYVWTNPGDANDLRVELKPHLVRNAAGSIAPAPGYRWSRDIEHAIERAQESCRRPCCGFSALGEGLRRHACGAIPSPSETNSQSEPELPFVILRTRNLRKALQILNRAVGIQSQIRNVGSRIVEVRSIRDVETFRPELNLHSLGCREFAE
jgi:hypothetical protein